MYISLYFGALFSQAVPSDIPVRCPDGAETHSAYCSHRRWVIPGFPTGETWIRNEETPSIFYGRASHYDPGVMWATALVRGFDREYLAQFDCLVTGFFINDVGRVAWLLHEGEEFRCLVVDNARAKDLYNVVILNRFAVEVEFAFAKDVLESLGPGHPIILVAYQIDRPTFSEWVAAQRLDEYLFQIWESDRWEPRGWIQVRTDQQAWYKLRGSGDLWFRIPGCLYCQNEVRYAFVPGEFVLYEVASGDSLALISEKIYGYSHPRFWDAIFEANQEVMPDPYFMKVGLQLRIPVYNKIAVDIESIFYSLWGRRIR